MDLSYIGVTERKIKQFNSHKIMTVEDLIRFIPVRYNDYTQETGIRSDGISCITARCGLVEYHNGRMPYISAQCHYGNITVRVVWFHQEYLYAKIRYLMGCNVYICGRFTPDDYHPGDWSCCNPVIFSDDIAGSKKILPIYPKIRGMSHEYLTGKIQQALTDCKLEDPIPRNIYGEYSLPDINTAYAKLHMPQTMDDIAIGIHRLDFDKILHFTLCMEREKELRAQKSPYILRKTAICKDIVDKLPYKLTRGQSDTIKQMVSDAYSGKRLSALVQGDVGCGKSIVAFLMAIAFAENNYQTAIMAPTQVLAKQHYQELSKLLEGTGVSCILYEGTKMKASARKKGLNDIAAGDIQIVIGTHALLSPDIQYASLALTIIDEEHKFGVIQKETVSTKAAEGIHSITMSATPIPRSLSKVLYGDTVDVYTIKDMPPGRQKIKNCVTKDRKAVYRFLTKELNKGHQAYVVCPAIEANEAREDLRNVNDVFYDYKVAFPDKNIQILTGKQKKNELATILDSFNSGETDILISTTVIEVGVNVPNATVMIIENADNFGLAQLHQLRGRVGRGNDQGYCVFMSDKEDNPRLAIISSTTDGFVIAEEDMKLRGTGEIIGERQSGDDGYILLILSSEYNSNMYRNLRNKASQLIKILEIAP